MKDASPPRALENIVIFALELRYAGFVTAPSRKMPVLFVGHGNPMNAVADNAFTQRLTALGEEIPHTKAVLCISAHWMTEGTWVTGMEKPKTIHDFYGFPPAFFAVQYPAPGDPGVARFIERSISDPHLGQRLRRLRSDGILVLGNGNIVHNLRRANFSDDAKPFPWAIEFDEWVKARLIARDFASLVNDATKYAVGKLSIPTPEHWYPFLCALGAAEPDEPLRFEYEGVENASISMRCVSFGMPA